MSDPVRPHRRQPTRLLRPWDSPGMNTGVGYHFLLQCMKGKRESDTTLSDPMDCSLLDFSVHGIFQARVLEWGASAFSDNKHNNKEKAWGIVRITKMWQRHEMSKCCWKNSADSLAWYRAVTNLQFLKNKQTPQYLQGTKKCNKTTWNKFAYPPIFGISKGLGTHPPRIPQEDFS